VKAVRLKQPKGTLSQPYFDEKELRKTVNRRLGPFVEPLQVIEPGVQIGPKRESKGFVAEVFTRRLLDGEVGQHLVIHDSSKRVLHGRTVQTAPDAANTTGSSGVDLLVGFLQQKFPGQWESWGIYNFKHIAGSSTWSDHSYVNHNANPPWCGRAIDVHPHSIAIGDQIEAAAKAEPALVAVTRYILWRGVPDHYPGHLHFSFEDAGAPGSC
jgi:hypothetical protein